MNIVKFKGSSGLSFALCRTSASPLSHQKVLVLLVVFVKRLGFVTWQMIIVIKCSEGVFLKDMNITPLFSYIIFTLTCRYLVIECTNAGISTPLISIICCVDIMSCIWLDSLT